MKTLFLALIGICSISGSSAVTCYECNWNLLAPTVQPECKEDATLPETAAFTCPDAGETAAVVCQKTKDTVNGVTININRRCEQADSATSQFASRGIPDNACITQKYANGETHSCYCHDDKCNGASAATFGIAMILLLLAAAHQMILH